MKREQMLERAKTRVFEQGVVIYRVEGTDDVYMSPAKTKPGHCYMITVDDGDPRCGCPSALYRGLCKHQEAVAGWLRVEAMLKAAGRA